MAWPDNYQGCTISGHYVDNLGAPISGSVIFTASPPAMLDFAEDVTIVPRSLSVDLDVNGSFTIVVPATDDPDISPIGWTYHVFESFTGGREYSIRAPQGEAIQLTEVAPVPDALGNPIVRGPRGLDGRVLTVQGQEADEASDVDLSAVIPLLANNGADYPNPAAFRAAMGILSAALHQASDFATAGQVAAALKAASNLADLSNITTALLNLGLDPGHALATLGLGTAATHPDTYFATALDSSKLARGYLGGARDVTSVVNFGGGVQTLVAPTVVGPLSIAAGRAVRVQVKASLGLSSPPGTQVRVATVAAGYTINQPFTPANAISLGGLGRIGNPGDYFGPYYVTDGVLIVPSGATNLYFGILLTAPDAAHINNLDHMQYFDVRVFDEGAA